VKRAENVDKRRLAISSFYWRIVYIVVIDVERYGEEIVQDSR
jgi:hypothetical protein